MEGRGVPPPQASLLGLPAELRFRIWGYVCTPKTFTLRGPRAVIHATADGLVPENLRLLCRQIRSEARHVSLNTVIEHENTVTIRWDGHDLDHQGNAVNISPSPAKHAIRLLNAAMRVNFQRLWYEKCLANCRHMCQHALNRDRSLVAHLVEAIHVLGGSPTATGWWTRLLRQWVTLVIWCESQIGVEYRMADHGDVSPIFYNCPDGLREPPFTYTYNDPARGVMLGTTISLGSPSVTFSIGKPTINLVLAPVDDGNGLQPYPVQYHPVRWIREAHLRPSRHQYYVLSGNNFVLVCGWEHTMRRVLNERGTIILHPDLD